MVIFTCNNCGESLQKPKVAKHYQFQCRRGENLTCVDCHKDFYGQEYVAHTKCVTELERYGGPNYVPRPGQNKGARKQEEWINVVKNVIDTAPNLSREEKNCLNILSNHENIPRKKAKFLNFIRSVMGHRVNMTVVDSVWTKMETAFKETVEQSRAPDQVDNGQNKANSEENVSCSPTKHRETSVAENQNNENICRENGKTATSSADPAENGSGKKKKSKKRDLAVSQTEQEDQPLTKKNKKKPEETVAEASTTVNNEDNQEIEKFNWKATILEIVGSTAEIGVKKLRKRVVNRYMNHFTGTVTLEKANSRFDKKLKKFAGVVVNDDKGEIAQRLSSRGLSEYHRSVT